MKYPRLPEHLNRSKKLMEEDRKRIFNLRSLGFTLRDIADHFKVRSSTVWAVLNPEAKKLISSRNEAKRRDDPKRRKYVYEKQALSTAYRREVVPDHRGYVKFIKEKNKK